MAGLQASPLTQPGDDAAQLIGSWERPAQYLYSVNFLEIDGEYIGRNRDIIWLEPGRYTLTVQMIVQNPPGIPSRSRLIRRDDDFNKIDLVVEAGKRYYIQAKFDRTRKGAPYRTVLHRVVTFAD